jgi:hypothetical protein
MLACVGSSFMSGNSQETVVALLVYHAAYPGKQSPWAIDSRRFTQRIPLLFLQWLYTRCFALFLSPQAKLCGTHKLWRATVGHANSDSMFRAPTLRFTPSLPGLRACVCFTRQSLALVGRILQAYNHSQGRATPQANNSIWFDASMCLVRPYGEWPRRQTKCLAPSHPMARAGTSM